MSLLSGASQLRELKLSFTEVAVLSPISFMGRKPMETFRVDSIQEAVELAYCFQEEGRYDWFRGQVQIWPPISSLQRMYLDQGREFEKLYHKRLEMFCYWLSNTPQLCHLLDQENWHELFAVLQHYGIPTHYIDFTTDPGVAAFFAGDAKHAPAGDCESVIFCLNKYDLSEFCATIKDALPQEQAQIELVMPEVRQLWRLEAQRGVFVYANYNWDTDYPLDRIIFPYSGPVAYPTPEQIFPEHKSSLEQLLDRYFFIEKGKSGLTAHKKMVQDLNHQGSKIAWFEVAADPGYYWADAFIDNVGKLLLWTQDIVNEWLQPLPKAGWESGGYVERLKMHPEMTALEVYSVVKFGVLQAMRFNKTLRDRSLDWELQYGPAVLFVNEVREAMRTVWNGMRDLPYDNDDIAEALAKTCQLLMCLNRFSISVNEQTEAVGSVFLSPLRVEFGCDDGSYSVAYAAKDSIRKIIRHDFNTLLMPETRAAELSVSRVLQLMYNPRILFEFVGFSKFFAAEIIPTQVATGRSLVLFNPAHLLTFGLK